MTQEQMDKKIAQHEQMQKTIEERKAEQEKKLEAYKTELAAKVSAGEITQEEMDKKIEQYGKKVPGKNFGRRLGRLCTLQRTSCQYGTFYHIKSGRPRSFDR